MNSFLYPIELQTLAKSWAPRLVNFVPAFAYHFCLACLICSIHANVGTTFYPSPELASQDCTCSRRSSPCLTRPRSVRMAPSAPAASPCPPAPSATSPSRTRSRSDAGRPRRPESRTARETTEIIACVMGKCCHVQSHVSHIVNPSYPLCVTALCTESSRYGLAMRKPKANQ